MRLIDADALKSYIDCGHLRPPTEVCFSELDVCNMIDKQPTIETIQSVGRYEKAMQKLQEMPRYLNGIKAKQIKRVLFEAAQGEWIYKTNDESVCEEWECSKCGNWNFVKTDFCPHCGADMREREKI